MKTIFTNGCFDIIHRSHLELLRFCKSRGKVIVGLNSDESVKRLKGASRPIFTQEDRKFVLENLECVDEVIIFEEDKGGDYKVEDIAGHDIAEVVLFPYNENNSTTKSLAKLGYS